MVLVVLMIIALGIALATGLEDMVVSKTITLGGATFSESQTVSNARAQVGQWTLPDQQPDGYPLPQTGALQVRGGNTTGTFLMDSALHNLTTSIKVDVYWVDANDEIQVQYNCTISSVTGTSVAIASGTSTGVGAVLPVVTTDCILAPRYNFPFPITGDNLKGLLANCIPTNGQAASAAAAVIEFDVSGTEDTHTLFIKPGQVEEWYQGSRPNPLAGVSITQVYISHNSTSVSQTVQVGALTT